MALDRSSPVPVAHQLYELIRGQIERGDLKPGERLPTEMEYCARLGISRTPVRRALGRLTAGGLLVRSAGRGTFVSPDAAVARRSESSEIAVTLPDERWCWPLQRAAAIWNDEHPERPVRLTFQIVGLAHLRSKLGHAVAGGAAGDIALVDSAWVPEFAERGYIQSLHVVDPALATRVVSDLLSPLRAENSHHGQLHGLPAEADLALLWYRRDWFRAEGVLPPSTWAELVAAAQQFLLPDVRRRYGLGPRSLAFSGGAAAGETTTYQLLPILWSAGADVIGSHEVVLNSPQACRAVAFVRDLVRVHGVAGPEVVDMPWNGSALAFASGSVALAFGGSYESGLIRTAAGWDESSFLERVGFVPIPAGPGGTPASLVGGMSYAIFRQSRQPRLALELLVRAISPEVVRDFCSRTGQNPPTISATRALEEHRDPFLHATSQLLKHARARWPLIEYARVSQQLGRMFEAAIARDLEPAQAVAAAAAVISGLTGLPEHGGARSAWQTTRRAESTRW